jgi:hypothetical protein
MYTDQPQKGKLTIGTTRPLMEKGKILQHPVAIFLTLELPVRALSAANTQQLVKSKYPTNAGLLANKISI